MSQLRISAGQHSRAGRKSINQDFHGLCEPREPLLASKGVAIAIADGIGSSAVSHIAAQAAVTSLLQDYYCTSETWSVRTSVERVLAATNSWLYAQTQQGEGRWDKDRGHVCTLSALVFKSATAHLFHVGDCRVWQLHGSLHASSHTGSLASAARDAHSEPLVGTLEPLTQDHRVYLPGGQSHLARALGLGPRLEIDYRALPLAPGDTFVLATDGIYEHLDDGAIAGAIAHHAGDLAAAAQAITDQAFERGSQDNLTVQIVRIEALPAPDTTELARQAAELPFPPMLQARMELDGFRILRELHHSARSHIYLAQDLHDGSTVALKAPSVDLQEDAAYRERFLLEEWVARRIDSPHVLKPCAVTRRREHLYVVMEHVEGHTLAQWMTDHPAPTLDAVRGIVGQIARGLAAFHRMEMLHQDLRPHNVMIDTSGTVKIIDFGATRVAGLLELAPPGAQADGGRLGTAQYTAPEYFVGEEGSAASDQFSLAVIAYQMLTGQLPYGTRVMHADTPARQKKLHARPASELRPSLPAWIDAALRKALDPDPRRRFGDVAEFAYALRHPDPSLTAPRRTPLIARDPVVFWKGVSVLLALLTVVLVALRVMGR